MINFEGAQVIWNISENRPANGDELANLINKGWLLMNFITRANDGKVWIDLADKAEDDFEIRRGLTQRTPDLWDSAPSQALSTPEADTPAGHLSTPPTSG